MHHVSLFVLSYAHVGGYVGGFGCLLLAVDFYYTMSRLFCKLHLDMNRVNVFAIHRCINEGYGLVRIFTEKIRISPTKLWRVCDILSHS